MRTDNIKVKLTIPIPYDRPDNNGVIYSKEAVEKVVNNLRTNLPIMYRDNGSKFDAEVIGAITGTTHIVTWDFENQVCNLTVDGVVFFGGTECIVNKIEDNIIKDFTITGIGLSK